MTDKPSNPQALPTGDHVNGGHDGMALRDWFAGQALAGTNPFELSGWGDAEIAERFYQIADAMLAERERGE
ncbi:MAG: hypothetical protein ACOY7L_17030 [Pseudomonadota bacterium]